jgi:hypothetical protein
MKIKDALRVLHLFNLQDYNVVYYYKGTLSSLFNLECHYFNETVNAINLKLTYEILQKEDIIVDCADHVEITQSNLDFLHSLTFQVPKGAMNVVLNFYFE